MKTCIQSLKSLKLYSLGSRGESESALRRLTAAPFRQRPAWAVSKQLIFMLDYDLIQDKFESTLGCIRMICRHLHIKFSLK